MKYSRFVLGMVVMLVLGGCAAHSMTRQVMKATPKLSSEAVFYVAINKDGSFRDEQYPKSGWMLSELIRKELSLEAYNIEMGEAYESYDHALAYAQKKGKDYLVYPEILHWENRATAWNSMPDRVKVQIKLVEVATGQMLDQMIIEAKGSSMALGGHPQDLLPYPMREYIEMLF